MTLIIHDLSEEEFNNLNINISDVKVIGYNDKIKNCVGCFGCWIKTPKCCVIKDGFQENNKLISEAEKVIVISKNCYGMFSPFVKNVLDRSLSYVEAYFCKKFNETHHVLKQNNKKINFDYYIYGDITDNEKETFKRLVSANSENLDSVYNINFIHNIGDFIYE